MTRTTTDIRSRGPLGALVQHFQGIGCDAGHSSKRLQVADSRSLLADVEIGIPNHLRGLLRRLTFRFDWTAGVMQFRQRRGSALVSQNVVRLPTSG
jgi:hypothetical protein